MTILSTSQALSFLYKPGLVIPPRVPRPGEPLWAFRKDDATWSCELRVHGEWGVEAQILREGELSVAHRFTEVDSETTAGAVAAACAKRKDVDSRGPSDSSPTLSRHC
jgi:hypothetical protein